MATATLLTRSSGHTTVDGGSFGDILISWSTPTPTGWDKLRLVRNANGTPYDERDGETLVEFTPAATTHSYQDIELTTGRFYYYGLFVLQDDVWSLAAVSSELVARDWGYAAKLYQRLPEVFRAPNYNDLGGVENEEDSFLYRFLSIFGFQFDHIRTELESLRSALNAQTSSQKLLPALGASVGVDYEPEIGTRALRRFIANAIRLWSIKGTLAGTRELASVLTGYPAHVRVGHNLALDNLDAGPTTDKGRWRIVSGGSIAYRANALGYVTPAGDGVRVIIPTGADVVGDTRRGGTTDALERLQYAIPVEPGLTYLVSQYFRTASAGVTAQSSITWLNADGVALSSNNLGTAVAVGDDWVSRPVHSMQAPSTARYLEPGFTLAGATAGQEILHCGFQVQESSTVAAWKPARETLVYLEGELVNHVGNTSGASLTGEGWSNDVEAVVDPELGTYLTRFTPDPIDENTVVVLDALAVDYPGDVEPPPADPADSLVRTEVWYVGARPLVDEGDVWSVLGEATPPPTDAPDVVRTASIGFRLYDGPDLVGVDWADDVVLTAGEFTQLSHEITVPENPTYDRIEVTLAFDGLCGFRRVALEETNLNGAFFFDGASESATSDYLWEGTAFASPTYFYDRRAARTVRLRGLLEDYLPHGSCFDLRFATSVIPDSPRAAAGADRDPADSPPTLVGTRLRLRWNVRTNVRRDVVVRYNTLA